MKREAKVFIEIMDKRDKTRKFHHTLMRVIAGGEESREEYFKLLWGGSNTHNTTMMGVKGIFPRGCDTAILNHFLDDCRQFNVKKFPPHVSTPQSVDLEQLESVEGDDIFEVFSEIIEILVCMRKYKSMGIIPRMIFWIYEFEEECEPQATE